MTESIIGKVDASSANKLKLLTDLDSGKLSPADPTLTTWRFSEISTGMTHDLDVAESDIDPASFAFKSKIDGEWSKLANLAGVTTDEVAETLEKNDYDYFGLISSKVFPDNKAKARVLAVKMRENGTQLILAADGELQGPGRNVSDDEIIARVPVLTRSG